MNSDCADSQKRGAIRDHGIPREIPWGLKPKRSHEPRYGSLRAIMPLPGMSTARVSSTERCKLGRKPRVDRSEKTGRFENKSGVYGLAARGRRRDEYGDTVRGLANGTGRKVDRQGKWGEGREESRDGMKQNEGIGVSAVKSIESV